MKKTILIGSIFACFLMLMIPNISAIECNALNNNEPDFDEEELKALILQRINELKVINPNLQPCWTADDPDGPFEGGLDDSTDWIDLMTGSVYGIFLGLFFYHKIFQQVLEEGDIHTIIIWIIDYGLYTWGTLHFLGDAFDIIDPDEDGY